MRQLTEEQRMLLDMVRELAQEKIAPRAAEIDQSAEYPWDVKDALAKLDLLALPFPEEYGGTGTDLLTICMVIEEIAKVCATSALIIATQTLGSLPISLAGTPEQKQRFFPRLASGEWIAAFAITEPGAGSDAAAMRTRAVLDGDSYVLNGSKHFITNAGIAHVNTVVAMTDPTKGVKGLSAFIVESDRPGFSVGKIEHKMGIRGSRTGELVFSDCRIPVTNLLGKEGDGFKIAMMTLDRSRPEVAAQALGIAQGALDYACRYAKERVQFGGPIANLQAIQFMLADMAMQIEASRLLVYQAAAAVDHGDKNITMLSAMAKCFAGDTAMRVTVDALQVLGGYGYMTEYPLERMMRDAKITQIYEGTNQIQRLVIARNLLNQY
ncbi:MAG: acyl-CoA dehydrogenase family protein [Chloroflexota bacterium]|nr:acyl-CoA dehydrogenase family protein [Chloroflexota bacterium]